MPDPAKSEKHRKFNFDFAIFAKSFFIIFKTSATESTLDLKH